MKISPNEFEFLTLTKNDVPKILDLQDRVIASLENPDVLRKNTEQMFLECVQKPNLSLGVFYGGELIAIGILYFVTRPEEDLVGLLVGVDTKGKRTANSKLCMVDKPFRGNGLQCMLGERLEKYAKDCGVELLCATVSPSNPYSENNLLKLGFIKNVTLQKYGAPRNLLYKKI